MWGPLLLKNAIKTSWNEVFFVFLDEKVSSKNVEWHLFLSSMKIFIAICRDSCCLEVFLDPWWLPKGFYKKDLSIFLSFCLSFHPSFHPFFHLSERFLGIVSLVFFKVLAWCQKPSWSCAWKRQRNRAEIIHSFIVPEI